MKKILLLSLLITIGCKPTIENNKNTYSFPTAMDGHGNLSGGITFEGIQRTPHKHWFELEYESYAPQENIIKELKPLLKKGITIKGFVASWCNDSKREVPRLYKILHKANFNTKHLSLYGMSLQNKTPDGMEIGLNIEAVPTFIFYRKGEEIGRFVETAQAPSGFLEEDILNICRKSQTKTSGTFDEEFFLYLQENDLWEQDDDQWEMMHNQ